LHLLTKTVVAAGAALVLAAFWLGRGESPAVAPPPPAAVQAPAARVASAANVVARDGTSEVPAFEGVLAITADGRLVPNETLRDVLTYFLLQRAGGDGDAALNNYLGRRLPPPAVAEAMRLAASYRAYMAAHDDLLAAQNLQLQGGVTTAALVRLPTWREQRARLRQRWLGNAVALAWYQDDDLQLTQAIDELQRGGETPGTAAPQDMAPADGVPARPVPHWTNKADQDRHAQYLLGVIVKATTSFDALKRAAR
jgi:hypothetical protein